MKLSDVASTVGTESQDTVAHIDRNDKTNMLTKIWILEHLRVVYLDFP